VTAANLIGFSVADAAAVTSVNLLPPGKYRVEWDATSTDRHQNQGSFNFGVGGKEAVPEHKASPLATPLAAQETVARPLPTQPSPRSPPAADGGTRHGQQQHARRAREWVRLWAAIIG
jgi:hypothetical protein